MDDESLVRESVRIIKHESGSLKLCRSAYMLVTKTPICCCGASPGAPRHEVHTWSQSYKPRAEKVAYDTGHATQV